MVHSISWGILKCGYAHVWNALKYSNYSSESSMQITDTAYGETRLLFLLCTSAVENGVWKVVIRISNDLNSITDSHIAYKYSISDGLFYDTWIKKIL
jgi:hypothetical protein